MAKKGLILTLFVLALFLFSCAAPESTTEDSTVVVEPTTTSDSGRITAPETTPTTTAPTQAMTKEVKELLEKHKTITSVNYNEDSGTYDAREVWIKGSLIKKTARLPRTYDNPAENYDTVYIDRSQQKAYGYCTSLDVAKCPAEYRGFAYELSYSEHNILTPFDIYKDVDYAEKTGTSTVDNRKSTIIQYTNKDGNKEKLFIDNYFGFILKQEIYDSNDEILEKHTFTQVAFDNLKDQDVNLPEGVEIQ
ncbi:hypothetical protein KY306_00165 [Candidatus Woesearchaeota archaeon]|nr:hypothetical protein [Candidatus Woesearchaeota archaeon]